ncbi:DNA replication and repair protein RecF [Polymorphobacter multimanifer]|uniref:DNA replication and repair protein RecF n=1 Tax=Polymorphobacter multimanifer TaxID=1070431 RepID=A0A841L5A9_9SPHN|nr:DNA replication/repair protein RecF [Polymorphobacter multimanifer]MBB6226153.1 DNA replication and repair protein RecF [Polymorphobacter multimanifer]
MVAVTRLALTDVRSHAALALEAAPGLVAITGENGAGKTNILESVSLLAPGRGLRGASLGEVARIGGAGGFSIAATLMAAGGAVELGTGTLATAPERRVVRVNGAARPASALGEWVSVVWLTPAMDRLFAESAGGRRRFLDRLVLALHPGHARETLRYEAAMRGRTRLLTGHPGADSGWLGALEGAMEEHGGALLRARADTVTALSEALADAPEDGFARPLLRLEDSTPADLAAALKRNRGLDAAAGRALIGPHRADLGVVHAGKGMPAGLGSTGEQKALLIAIVLAHAALVRARTGEPPLMLLDEIAAHLDAPRRTRLFSRLAETGAQVWMTGTDRSLFDAADGATRFDLPNRLQQ